MKNFIVLLIMVCFAITANAQKLYPLYGDKDRQATDPKFSNLKISNQALSLPFFDDFAESDVQLNPTKWMPGGGTYLNNTYATGQPSKNVVTFDGLKANGRAYVIGATNPGRVDTLTSRPIDLSGVTPADSLYLSFFYQAGGLGEVPDTDGQLLLEFKKGNNTSWETLPSFPPIIGSGDTTGFKLAMVYIPIGNSTIPNLSYYHANFQFRFVSVGFQAGAGDIWNIDYVYLNTNRHRNDTVFFDVAATSQPTSLLTPYTAMPIRHYLTNPESFHSDKIIQGAGNLNSSFRIAQYTASVRNRQVPGSEVIIFDSIQNFNEFSHYNLVIPNMDSTVIDNTDQPRQLQYEFYIVSPAVGPEPYQYRFNDTIRHRQVLSNYFAYDDGTAEAAYGLLDAKQAAIKFTPAIPDTLKAIDYYIVPFRDDMIGSAITLMVWEMGPDGMPSPDTAIFSQAVSISYTDLNAFKRFELPVPIPVSGPFFIGWKQVFSSRFLIGADINNNSSQFRLVNIGGVWQPEPDTIEASLMFRAVMGGDQLANAPAELAQGPGIKVFPNPGSGVFYFSGQVEVVDMYDQTGRQISVNTRGQNNQVDLSGMPAGLYLVRVRHQNRISTHKLMLQN